MDNFKDTGLPTTILGRLALIATHDYGSGDYGYEWIFDACDRIRELEKALQWAMGHLQEVGGADNPEYVAARAAIAKATNEHRN